MAALVWDESSKKYYETGVSKTVLYPYNSTGNKYDGGVAWNGITGITESPSGAEANKIYADNILYATLRSAEEFGFTITAYTYPDEWAECDGSTSPVEGVFFGQQARKTFGLCYRTEVGNDLTESAGYILHLVYGATASPSERQYQTKNDSPEAIEFSWECETVPVEVTGYKPIAHIQIDSRTADKTKLEALESKLYGSSSGSTTPEMPLPAQVITMMTAG